MLLDDDRLVVIREEAAFEGLVRWMKAENGTLRGRGLLSKIRFPLMDEGYLESTACQLFPSDHAEWIQGLVLEALEAKAAGQRERTEHAKLLGAKASVPRVGGGVDWARYADGGGVRLEGHTGNVLSLAECQGRICSAASDGSIRVWDRATATLERSLHADEDNAPIALAAWGRHVVSSHDDGTLMVWDVAQGACEQVLVGHSGPALTLAVCGQRLLSGSWDKSVRVWGMDPALPWACERTLVGHTGQVESLAAWQGKAISGGSDQAVRVWDAATGALDAVLAGNDGVVAALLVHGDRLFSAGDDGRVRVWAAGTWAPLQEMDAWGEDGRRHPWCLAVSGRCLVAGLTSESSEEEAPHEVWVWGLEGLALERVVRLSGGEDAAAALLAVGREVWAGVGDALLVWGRE